MMAHSTSAIHHHSKMRTTPLLGLLAVCTLASLGMMMKQRSSVLSHFLVEPPTAKEDPPMATNSLKFVLDATTTTTATATTVNAAAAVPSSSSLERSYNNNNNNDNRQNSRRRRPILVLHVGPHKTATSTLQCDLSYYFAAAAAPQQQPPQPSKNQHYDSNNETMADDDDNSNNNFVYLGRQYGECLPRSNNKNKQSKTGAAAAAAKYASADTRRLIACLDRHHSSTKPCDATSGFARFERTLSSLAQQQQNAILSDEAFSRMKMVRSDDNNGHQLLLATLHRYFEVRLVVNYRRYFAWLLSQYNEHYKPLPNRKHYQRWPTVGSGNGDDERGRGRGGGGGSPMRPFVEFYQRLEEQLRNKTDIDRVRSAAAKGDYPLAAARSNLHPAAYLLQLWTRQATSCNITLEKTVVVNIHDDDNESGNDDVTGKFVRQALSKEAYEKYRQQMDNDKSSQRPPGRPNPSWNLDYNMLAVEARAQGLFDTKHNNPRLTRSRVARYVERLFAEKAINPANLPRVCLNETQLRQFRDRSLDLERTLFDNNQLPLSSTTTRSQLERWRERHEADFANAARAQKFCNLDARQLLLDPDVRAVFELLNTVQ